MEKSELIIKRAAIHKERCSELRKRFVGIPFAAAVMGVFGFDSKGEESASNPLAEVRFQILKSISKSLAGPGQTR